MREIEYFVYIAQAELYDSSVSMFMNYAEYFKQIKNYADRVSAAKLFARALTQPNNCIDCKFCSDTQLYCNVVDAELYDTQNYTLTSPIPKGCPVYNREVVCNVY